MTDDLNAPRYAPPQGALRQPDGSVQWRVWAPYARRVRLKRWLGGVGMMLLAYPPEIVEMTAEGRGFYVYHARDVPEGTFYQYCLDDGPWLPDPASRSQPGGAHKASAVYTPSAFPWTDHDWKGVSHDELVLYELHVGTFTRQGTFESAIARLPDLVELGVNAIELLPVAQFPGKRNWGYDGVLWYAVQNSYGGPLGLQKLVDAAHNLGLGVYLDLVYNHFGPEGNYLGEFGPYLRQHRYTPWGAAVNYDHADCEAVRQFVIDNAAMWVRDFHVDGLRLDAVQEIRDRSKRHILAEVQTAVERIAVERGRPALIFGETDENDPRYFRPQDRDGYGIAGVWSDCFHHAVHAFLTQERVGYYQDFGDAESIAKAFNQLFVVDGGFNVWRGKRHGMNPKGFSHRHLVQYLQNHDQVGNRPEGDRLSVSLAPAQLRWAAALFLITPGVPMLWMGEEYAERAPFPFFCSFDHPGLNDDVDVGRRREALQFGFPDVSGMAVPGAKETYLSAHLHWEWPAGTDSGGLRKLYQDLLALRRSHPGLADREHSQAELLSLPWDAGAKAGLLPSEPNVLRIRRGQPSAPALDCWFNLTPDPVRLPSDLASPPFRLRTESPRYAPARATDPGSELVLHGWEAVMRDERE